MADQLFVGLMSGTSLDGVDAVLVRMPADTASGIQLLAAHCEPIPSGLRERILSLCASGDAEIERLGTLDIDLAHVFALSVQHVLNLGNVSPTDVTAIGSHGQTIRHRPHGQTPFTMQIGDPNTLAELTGITTVADFRRRDMAAGGQGAPLVPAFHAATFRSPTKNRAVINIGGMANVTLLPAAIAESVRGFDTGPGNVLLDAWHQRHHGTPLDKDGAWAASGDTNTGLLAQLLADPYFLEQPPKSTGREHFNLGWLDEQIAIFRSQIASNDIQATLGELTASSIADALRRWGGNIDEVFLCGGGTHNADLCARIGRQMPGTTIKPTSALGIDPAWVEAMAFAWLAQRTLAHLPGNLPAVTGARAPVVLGGIYPGRAQSV